MKKSSIPVFTILAIVIILILLVACKTTSPAPASNSAPFSALPGSSPEEGETGQKPQLTVVMELNSNDPAGDFRDMLLAVPEFRDYTLFIDLLTPSQTPAASWPEQARIPGLC